MTSQQTPENRQSPVRAVPAARWKARREGIDLFSVAGTGPGGTVLLRDVEKQAASRGAPPPSPQVDKILVSSLARKLAEKKGVALEAVEGSGTRGRIMMEDVARAAASPASAPKEPPPSLFGRVLPMSQMRKVISKRMGQSAFTAPHIYFFADVEMDRLEGLRREILPEFESRFGVRLSLNDFLIKAAALTILDYPLLNGRIEDDAIHIMPDINVGLAVALPEGLIVPAVPRADQLGLGAIARLRADLVERARSGRLKLEEIERGTFTVSSLAQFEITFFTAILNPPQSGILSVGKTCEQLALREGQVIVKKVARLGLSVDHRIIDGAVAAAFLQALKGRLENPALAFMHL
jgi:pyruvate dehydrogenase E2 component (dihydrolipoamide acetyltransferase)